MRARGLMVVLAVLLVASVQAACGGAPAQPAAKAPAAASSPSAGAGVSTGASVGGAPVSASAAAAASAPARPKELVNFAIPQKSMNYIVPIAAHRLGYFDEAGFDVDIQSMPSNLTVAAMQRGDLQITASGGSAVRAAVRGAPFKLVSFMTVRPTFYLLTHPDIRTPAQLVGKRIAVSDLGGSQSSYMRMFAQEQGLDPSQILLIGMGPNAAVQMAALQNGALDGSVFDVGTAAFAEVQGYYLLRHLGEVAPQPLQGVVATEDYIQKSPERVRAFLKALVRGLRYVRQQPRETAAIAREEVGHDMDEATALRAVQLYADVIWPEAPGYADEKLLDAFYLYDVKIPLEMPPEQALPPYHDFRFLLEAYDELGIPRPRP
jgi:NitT/TauT family transport system substrate-binding protein